MKEMYRGRLGSQDGVQWEVVLLGQDESVTGTAGELRMPADEPLVIEWQETAKEDPVVSSAATLRVISPGDRTYEGLYAIEPGSVRMDVYREGALYWSGAMDTELYEEPYATTEGYEVELTFTDMGILERLKFDLSGVQNCRDLLEYALEKSGINYTAIDESLMTTTVAGAAAGGGLEQLMVRSENWYDEDGEASTLREVVEGILQPLGLRLEQRNGKMWVYDLNGAYESLPTEEVRWMGDDQTLSVDKVVNNAKISLSTYSSAEVMSGDLTYPGTVKSGKTNITNQSLGYYSYYEDLDPDLRIDGQWDYTYLSFTLYYTYSSSLRDLAYKLQSAPYYHIEPLLGGEESDGVAYMWYTGGHGNLSTGWPVRCGGQPTLKTETLLMTTKRVYLPKLGDEDRKRYYVRLTQEILVDCRYNPFVTASTYNEEDNQGKMEVWFGYVMIPAAVTLYDSAGKALWHYSNESVATSSNTVGSLGLTKGTWKSGAAKWGEMWLEWYDPDDRKEKTGVGGWQANRQCIGLSTKKIMPTLSELEDGQYMEYPPEGGWLEVSLYIGIWPYDYGEKTWLTTKKANEKDMYSKLRWMLYKLPKIDVVQTTITQDAAETDDVGYWSHVNESAKEDLEIDTVCGTMETPCPTSKALYLNATTLEPVSEMTRAGRTTQAERLLLGTLYSQYADRKAVLSGTAAMGSGDLKLMTDASMEGVRLIVLSDVQDVAAGTSEVKLVELRPDEYDEKRT